MAGAHRYVWPLPFLFPLQEKLFASVRLVVILDGWRVYPPLFVLTLGLKWLPRRFGSLASFTMQARVPTGDLISGTWSSRSAVGAIWAPLGDSICPPTRDFGLRLLSSLVFSARSLSLPPGVFGVSGLFHYRCSSL